MPPTLIFVSDGRFPSMVFIEVVLITQEAHAAGIDGRDEVDDRLTELLEPDALGEVTGGGGGLGRWVVDVEIPDEQFDRALGVIRKGLSELRVPASTLIKRHGEIE